MSDLPVIETERLRLFIAGPKDADRVVTFNHDNADFLRPWEPTMSKAALNVASVREARSRAQDDARAGMAYGFAFVARGSAIETPILGWCNVSRVTRGVFQCANLGYKLDERFQGLGYMTEALTGLISFLFDEARLHRIEAAYMPHNQRSAAVLRRLGFTIEGSAKAYLYIAGAWRDHVLTSLTNPDPLFEAL